MKSIIKKAFLDLFDIEISEQEIQIQDTRSEFEGDQTLVLFPFVKKCKMAPVDLGNQLGEYLITHADLFTNFNVVNGFLNLSFHPSYWFNELNKALENESFGRHPKTNKTYIIEYSSPNTNKPLHLGHLRNNFLGYAVAEILKANGHDVIKTQIINDRGIHICKSMYAWKMWGNNETPESANLKGDHLVGKYYVKFDQEYKSEQKAILNELLPTIGLNDTDAADAFENEISAKNKEKISLTEQEKNTLQALKDLREKAKKEAPSLIAAQKMLQDWEKGVAEVVDLWKKMNAWVYEGFNATYAKIGVDFDQLYYESDTYILGKDHVEDGLDKGVFFKKEDGSVWCDLSAEKLDEKLLLRGDGTSVYMTQDIGTAIERYKDFPQTNGMIYTVGNEQDYHFKVLFSILKKLGYDWANELYHLSYGMVDLPTGKMKSREGTVVDADDLVNELVEKAKEQTEELGKLEDADQKEKETLFEMIGLGAIKYFLLKVEPKKRMLFNPEESVQLQGDTAPFIQYTHARIQSLLNKANFKPSPISNQNEIDGIDLELLKKAHLFPQTIAEAGKGMNPAAIINYLFDLVKVYNRFYQSNPILIESNEELKQLRLNLSYLTARNIKTGMKLLGIDVPNRM